MGTRPPVSRRFAEALNAGWLGAPGAGKLLADLIADHGQPAIARASAVVAIGSLGGRSALAAMRQVVGDNNSAGPPRRGAGAVRRGPERQRPGPVATAGGPGPGG